MDAVHLIMDSFGVWREKIWFTPIWTLRLWRRLNKNSEIKSKK
jgi:hypothetical protein